MSNWEVNVLNFEQIRYAAWDALMGKLVYDHQRHVLGAFDKSISHSVPEDHLKVLQEQLVAGERTPYKALLREASEVMFSRIYTTTPLHLK